MTHLDVNKVLNRLPHDPANIWCAGGAAICPEKANDIDIFLLKGVNYAMLNGYSIDFDRADEYPHKRAIRFASNITLDGLPVQVIGTSYLTIQALLDEFDLSVHAHAVNQLGQRVSHPLATQVGQPITLINPHDLEKTATRLEKLRERYSVK